MERIETIGSIGIVFVPHNKNPSIWLGVKRSNQASWEAMNGGGRETKTSRHTGTTVPTDSRTVKGEETKADL